MDLSPIGANAARPVDASPSPGTAKARATAEAFEAAFLAEMLKHTGVNALPSEFGGGAGEDAFASLLTQEYAELLAARGGIGLAERVFEILKQRTPGE